MDTKTVIVLPSTIRGEISKWAEAAYPNEGCGLLIGRFEAQFTKTVSRFAPLTNELLTKNVENAPTLPPERQGTGAGKTEFVMNPDEFNRISLESEKSGLDVVGILHTHPDHPPRPSRIDASQPFLAQWSNVIVAVEKGKTAEMKSWFRETDEEEFREEEIKTI